MIDNLVHSLNHKQTNDSLFDALSSSVQRSNLWCAERLVLVRKQWQDKETLSPVLRLSEAISLARSTVEQLQDHRPAKMVGTL